MNQDEIKQILNFRMKESKECLEDAESLYKTFRYRSSINRAYYPMFYCALALINTREISSSKHSGVISIFDKEFVKTGEFPKYTSKWIHEAFMKRQESDYLDFKEITQE